jgi:hypothetical protein
MFHCCSKGTNFWENVNLFTSSRQALQPQKTKKGCIAAALSMFCDPEESRTPNLLIRSQMLYPIKLRGQIDWGKYTAADEFYKKHVDII